MTRLRVATPLWLEGHDQAGPTYAPISRSFQTDVVIVGGGVTGAAAAWRFARAGVGIAVVEAARVGRGSTSASTALLMQEPDKDFRELRRWYGPSAARRIWQASIAATRGFVETLADLRIDCALERRDSIYYAISAAAGRRLREELRQRRRALLPGTWLGRQDLKAATGISGSGAIRTAGNAQLDPFRACSGLLRAAIQAGAIVFEDSAVDRIETRPHDVLVRTRGCTVRCGQVIVATGYATPFFAPLAARFRMLQTYVAATRPLTAAERSAIGLSDVMLWDTGRPYHYARWTSDGRLLLGGEDRPRVPEPRRRAELARRTERVREYFVRRFPALAGIDVEFAWEGLFATTPDGLPYIGAHPDYPRHLFALGYGGNGMTFGYLAARLLLDQHRGERSSDHALFGFERHP